MPKTSPRRSLHLALLAGLLAAGFAGMRPARAAAPDEPAPAAAPVQEGVAARVNGEPILRSRVDGVLDTWLREKGEAAGAQVDAAPGGTPQARRIVLQRLIDLQLVVQKARELGWAQPRAADVPVPEYEARTARDYFGRLIAEAKEPSDAEIRAYYDAHPALFSKRRVYQFEDLTIEVPQEQQAELKEAIQKTRTVDELKRLLGQRAYIFKVETPTRAAEQLPLAQLDNFHKMKVGHVTIGPVPQGLKVLILTDAQNKPVELKAARAAITAFLGNERKRALLDERQRVLRAAARIEYVDPELAPAPLPAP